MLWRGAPFQLDIFAALSLQQSLLFLLWSPGPEGGQWEVFLFSGYSEFSACFKLSLYHLPCR